MSESPINLSAPTDLATLYMAASEREIELPKANEETLKMQEETFAALRLGKAASYRES